MIIILKRAQMCVSVTHTYTQNERDRQTGRHSQRETERGGIVGMTVSYIILMQIKS